MIKDSGIGIPEDKLKNIFEMFTNAHEGDNGVISTSGIGLGL